MSKKQREEAKRLARIARAEARFAQKHGAGVDSVEPQAANACDLSPIEVATATHIATATSNGLESKGNDVCEAPVVPVAVTQPAPAPETSRKARIYGIPLNPRMRLIEFDDGTHGQLWVKLDDQRMLNWRIWVKPDQNRPNPPGVHWVMDGSYNWRGIRIK